MFKPAELVRERRKALGLSQQQLADLAGVSQTTIDKIENGRVSRSKFLQQILLRLGVVSESLDPPDARELSGLMLSSNEITINAAKAAHHHRSHANDPVVGDNTTGDEIWRRLRALEEHRNALQLVFLALARELPDAGRARLVAALPVIADAAHLKGESEGAALLRTLADVLASLG